MRKGERNGVAVSEWEDREDLEAVWGRKPYLEYIV